MDEWQKKKKAASNGGRGMVKYIDYEEQKRLSRLKNVRGSITQSMQHNSWQTAQLEKRRKEQIRQRKKMNRAEKKTKVFQVDTGCSATPYEFTKCGLKLRLEKSSTEAGKSRLEVKVTRETHKPASKPLESQYPRDSMQLNRRNQAPAQKNNFLPKRKDDIRKKKDKENKPKVVMQNKEFRDNSRGSNNSSSSSNSKGKENGDNQNHDKQTLIEGKPLLQRKNAKKKSADCYFMDFESLKREHADAIEMLKQLDEENKRFFVRKDGGGDSRRTEEEEEEEEEGDNDEEVDESFAVTLPEGMLHATHLSISLHDIEDDDLQDDPQVGDDPEAE
jgi:hypothetical protein